LKRVDFPTLGRPMIATIGLDIIVYCFQLYIKFLNAGFTISRS
jgi:hypothetical protein